MVDPIISPVPAPAAKRRSSGTSVMLIGAAVSAVGAYLFQVIGGRYLGAVAFAPVSVMWTVLFLGLTIFLMPIEQLVIRKLTLGGGKAVALHGSWSVILSVLGGASVAAGLFAFLSRGALLDNDVAYVPVAVLMILAYGLHVIGRGHLAGRGRFAAYGVVVGLDAIVKILGAILVALVGLGPVALSAVFICGPLSVILVRPFQHAPVETVTSAAAAASDTRFMGGLLVATAASQTVLAAGPIVVGALGASSAAISIFFVTTTLFRGPMTAAYNLIARILPGLTRRAAAGDHVGINRLVLRLAVAAIVSAAAVAAAAAMLGPIVVEALYGADFRPPGTLAALAAAGVVMGTVGLATTQVLVGRGETGRMAVSWLLAVIAATATIVLVGSSADIRVAAGFFVGEAVALVGLTVAALSAPREIRVGPTRA